MPFGLKKGSCRHTVLEVPAPAILAGFQSCRCFVYISNIRPAAAATGAAGVDKSSQLSNSIVDQPVQQYVMAGGMAHRGEKGRVEIGGVYLEPTPQLCT
jgi:hypothetical protein